jgi:arsenate reductase (thioredoxin)
MASSIELNSRSLLPALKETAAALILEFNKIAPDRRPLLLELSALISANVAAGTDVNLNFICTHNSRRSHISQVWAQAAASHYRIPRVTCFSGGTEATAFNPRAVTAMRDAGFKISVLKEGANPVYNVSYADGIQPLVVFSKKFDDPSNPDRQFVAIMTCNHADANCPIVTGASARIAITYRDPKDSDGSDQEAEVYKERVREIGREMLFVFAHVARI